MMRYFLIVIIIAAILTGCGGSFVKKDESELTGQRKRVDKIKYAALNTSDDKEIIPVKYPITFTQKSDSNIILDSTDYSLLDDSSLIIELEDASRVYRIQLFSSNTYGPASREEKIAREVFDSTVFLDYEVPYYKIRVGNFTNRTLAENYLPAAKESGYSTAWVVKVAKDIGILDDIYDGSEIPPLVDTTLLPDDSISPESEIDTSYEQYPEN